MIMIATTVIILLTGDKHSNSSNDNKALLAVAVDTARIWDVETGQCLRTLSGHKATILI